MYLNKLFEEEMSLQIKRPRSVETVGNFQSNYWLIQVPANVVTTNAIADLFKTTHLRYNTMAFAFTVNASKLEYIHEKNTDNIF